MDNSGQRRSIGGYTGFLVDSGNRYLTRMKMNATDMKRVCDHADFSICVEDGVCCIEHTFDLSGRSTYVYFSMDNWYRSYHASERRSDGILDTVERFRKGKVNRSNYVTIKKDPFATMDVRISMQDRFFPMTDDERKAVIMEMMPKYSGFFKLESSVHLTPTEALDKYCSRATAEHLIHSLKRISGLKPLRVWKGSSIRCSMLLALLAESSVAIARYRLNLQGP